MAQRPPTPPSTTHSRLAFNADLVAILVALGLAALVRFNVIHTIRW